MDEIDLPVHPSAAVFPMLPPDELAELAESIKENGLQNPIVMQRGVLIDGRNRYAACKLAMSSRPLPSSRATPTPTSSRRTSTAGI